MSKKVKYIVGVDEVGRGPVAGPVAVCGFIVSKDNERGLTRTIRELSQKNKIKDSKKLSAKKREEIVEEIQKISKENPEQVKYKIAFVSNKTIDRIGIVKSLELAVRESLRGLIPNECEIFLDGGLKAPKEFKNQKTIIKGDEKIKVISLASIVAKVARDEKMCEYSLDEEKGYHKYGFEKHKGYGTKLHMENIKKYGLSDLHRKSFLKNVI